MISLPHTLFHSLCPFILTFCLCESYSLISRLTFVEMFLLDCWFYFLFYWRLKKKVTQASGQQRPYSYTVWLLQVCFPALFWPILLFKAWQAFEVKCSSNHSFRPTLSLAKPLVRRRPLGGETSLFILIVGRWKVQWPWCYHESRGFSPLDVNLSRLSAPICSTNAASDYPVALCIMYNLSNHTRLGNTYIMPCFLLQPLGIVSTRQSDGPDNRLYCHFNWRFVNRRPQSDGCHFISCTWQA